MSVPAYPRVISEIPANMFGVFIDHDLITSPVPACDDIVIIGGNIPIEIAEPEALPIPSSQHEYALRSTATAEASMLPRLLDVIMRIIGSTSMSDPLIVPGVNVRNLRMAPFVRSNVILGRATDCRPWRVSRRFTQTLLR